MKSFITHLRSFRYFGHCSFALTKVSRTISDTLGIPLISQLPDLLLAGSPTGPLLYPPVPMWILRKSLTSGTTFVALFVSVSETYHIMIEPRAVRHLSNKHSKKFRSIVGKLIAVSSWWKNPKNKGNSGQMVNEPHTSDKYLRHSFKDFGSCSVLQNVIWPFRDQLAADRSH